MYNQLHVLILGATNALILTNLDVNITQNTQKSLRDRNNIQNWTKLKNESKNFSQKSSKKTWWIANSAEKLKRERF